MSYFTKVKMSYSQLQYPTIKGGYCGGRGYDCNESNRIKPAVCYTPDNR
jgi:hypothetical protein